MARDRTPRTYTTGDGYIAASVKPSKQAPWRKYGLTDQMYLAMVAQQGRRCAICHEESRLMVDHDHETGKVRALLCRRCNVTLGMLRDEPELAELMIRYLELHG